MAGGAALGLFWSWRHTTAATRARDKVERAVEIGLIACSVVAIVTTVGIVLSMLGESLRFFDYVKPADFFFGTTWNPRFSTVGDGGQGGFGLLPLLSGTLLIMAIAMVVAVPLGLMTAIYMAEYASNRVRNVAKPVIEVLAGIPTIVYGVFALIVVGPFLSAAGAAVGLNIRATSALTAGVVIGMMIIPFISSLSDDIITQVPRAMRDGSLALGGTKAETIVKVVLPAALPGIVGAAGREQGRRRDDDRGLGRRQCASAHGQPLRLGIDDHGVDRQPAHRRPGFREPAVAGRLRARVDALLPDAGAQHHRAGDRAALPRTIRVTP
jgi:phosphate transport system permease protein